MSGIARMLKHRGFEVKGTDSTPSFVVESLRAEGIEVWIGHSGEHVSAGDAIVLTDAIDLESSPEVAAARTLGCDLFRRSQALGWLLEGKKTIAVTGTHGKTTTTGMIGAGMRAAGLDPTIVVGAEVPEFGGAIVEGTSEWAVIEACEAYDSLRDFDPHIIVLTNLELDHVDFHGDWESLKLSVLSFVEKLDCHPFGGTLLYCADDQGSREIGNEVQGPGHCFEVRFYSLEDYTDHPPFDIPNLVMPGRHNALNAQGALLAVIEAGGDPSVAAKAISNYRGAERRLQVLFEGDVTVIDDYAHHPTEIVASLQAVRERWPRSKGFQPMSPQGHLAPTPDFDQDGRTTHGLEAHESDGTDQDGRVTHGLEAHATDGTDQDGRTTHGLEAHATGRLVVVYQPHLYSRTAPLIKEFAAALSLADIVVLTDIYPAREDPIPGVSSFRIAELVTKPCLYVPQRHLLPRKVAEIVQPGDVVVGMGAGNIGEFAPAFVEELRRHSLPGSLRPGSLSMKGEGWSRLKVAVLHAGDSAEREVSILSGREVCCALNCKGHDAYLFDASEALLSTGDLTKLIGADRPDVCFLAVHGTNAEDGAIQGLLELLHLPYTGSGIQASAIAMDKEVAKQLLARAGLPVPAGVLLRFPHLQFPPQSATGWVVKPNSQGSTVGLTFVESENELEKAIVKAFQFGDEVLVEEWLRGVEISVPVLGDKALPAVEIVPQSGTYDFESKYTLGATTEICPARISEEQTRAAQDQAMRAHQALGCKGCTRTDMIVLDDRIVCLEVNTLPGMTATSLVPNSAKTAGINFEDLCDWMVRNALEKTKA